MNYLICLAELVVSPCENLPPVPSGVEISLSFLISRWVLVGPGLEFPNREKIGGGDVSPQLVFLGQKKLIGALSGASKEFLFWLRYGKSICIFFFW